MDLDRIKKEKELEANANMFMVDPKFMEAMAEEEEARKKKSHKGKKNQVKEESQDYPPRPKIDKYASIGPKVSTQPQYTTEESLALKN